MIKRYNRPAPGNNYSFELLSPGKYVVRLIEDINQNREWDTGNYLEKIQPEKVIYYWKEIDLRANWDINDIFNTNQNYPDRLRSSTVSEVVEVQNNLIQP